MVDEFSRQGQPIIIAFWHGRQLMMPLAYRGRQASILISQHRDGEIIARIMHHFAFKAVRGSSTRGGMSALRHLLRAGRNGRDLVVTPDGPRGPACKVQSGVLYVAKVTGRPILPLTFACSKKKSFSSWDKFQIPYPWAKGLFVWGSPLWVKRDLPNDQLAVSGLELENSLNRLTAQAESAVQDSDPVQAFFRANFAGDDRGKNTHFQW